MRAGYNPKQEEKKMVCSRAGVCNMRVAIVKVDRQDVIVTRHRFGEEGVDEIR